MNERKKIFLTTAKFFGFISFSVFALYISQIALQSFLQLQSRRIFSSSVNKSEQDQKINKTKQTNKHVAYQQQLLLPQLLQQFRWLLSLVLQLAPLLLKPINNACANAFAPLCSVLLNKRKIR